MNSARHFSKVASVVSVALGLLVAIGWAFGVRSLVTVLPGLPAMTLNTALGLALAGTSLGLLLGSDAGSRYRRLRFRASGLLAAVVVVIGLMTISEYIFKVDLCINRLLFPQTLSRLESGWPTRPSPQTATNFVLIGAALFFLGVHRVNKRVPHALALLACSLSLTALLGYAYGISVFYSISPTIGMALHTAMAFTLLSIAVLFVHPDRGLVRTLFRKTLGGGLVRRLLPAVLLLPVLVGWLRLWGERSGIYSGEVGVTVMVVVTTLGLTGLTWLAAESLDRGDEQFRAVAETANDGVISANQNGEIMFMNKAAEKMFGYSAKEAKRQPLTLLMPQRFHSAHRQGFERFLSTGEGRVVGKTVEVAGTRKGGGEFPLELSLAAWRTGDKVHFTAIIRDISDRKKAEEDLLLRTRQLEAVRNEVKLKQSEERFSKAFRSSLIAITISTKGEGRYVDANEAFLKLLGYGWEEVVGHTASELNVWAVPEQRTTMIEKLEQSGQISAFETEFKTKSGETRNVQVAAELIDLDDTACVLAMTLDITEAKRLGDQFRQAQKMEAIGRLAGGVAHDFNNLLGVIIGYGDLAQQQSADASVRKHLEQIKSAGHRAASLTRQLLAFSRQQMLQPTVLNLNAVVNNLSNMLVRMIGEDVALAFTPAVPLPSVRADLQQIEQILMNLAVNARDAMPAGGKILIETANVVLDETYAKRHADVHPGSYVMLSVSDTGCGMDSKTMSQIFDPFFTTKPLGEGTGLGLSTVYGIVNQSGGHIWVYSELGKGTTFKIYFPSIEESAEAIVESKPQPVLATGSETVLVVEDDDSLRELVVGLLRSGGYHVMEAANASAAVVLSEQYEETVHLLLTDIIMPGTDGSELAVNLKKSRPELKVLYMSGYAGDLIAHHGVLEPGTPLLQKPFTQESLLRQVRTVLDHNERIQTGAKTILLVDDAVEFLELAHGTLRDNGYMVLEASSGEQAVEVTEQYGQPIHVLITDVSLPGMGGYALAKHLLSQMPELKVLYVSGHSDKGGTGQYLIKSGYAYLEKPYSNEELISKVSELLGR